MTNEEIAMLKRNRWLAIRNTPRKVEGRMVHQSTHYGWVQANPSAPAQFVKLAKGTTYRRPA